MTSGLAAQEIAAHHGKRLLSFPEFADETGMSDWLQATCGQTRIISQRLPTLTHTFSHYRLHLYPLQVDFDTPATRIMEGDGWLWYKAGTTLSGGLSAAVRQFFQNT